MMPTCDQLLGDLIAYADQDLHAARKELLEAHLSVCGACRRRLEDYSALDRLLRESSPLPDTSVQRAELYARVQIEADHVPWRRPVADAQKPLPIASQGHGNRPSSRREVATSENTRHKPFPAALMLTATVMVVLGFAMFLSQGPGLAPDTSSGPAAATQQPGLGAPRGTATAGAVAPASSPTTADTSVPSPTPTVKSVASYRVTYKAFSGADRITVIFVDGQGDVQEKEVKPGWTYTFTGRPGQTVYVTVIWKAKGGPTEKLTQVSCQLLVDGRPVDRGNAGGKEARQSRCVWTLPEK